MRAFAAALYGALTYLLFQPTFLYLVGFVGNVLVPKSIDSGTPGPVVSSIIIDIGLLSLFAIQHSVMARPTFKRIWTRLVPQAVERATYVLFACMALILLYVFWRPLPAPVWFTSEPLAVLSLQAISGTGYVIALISTFLINHFELFGLRQIYARLRGRRLPPAMFKAPLFYKRVRHPIYLGFLIAFWATPAMTVGHLLFAIVMTGYVLIGIYLEERDLIALFGEQYCAYRRQVAMLIPLARSNAADVTTKRA
jgi:protein-S-isoprenylcysteine O-methyltransferase Ste14